MTAFYDFFRFIKLYSTDGTTLEHTIEADAVTDTLSISRGTGVSWTPASSATDSFKIDVNYNLEVPVGTTTLRLTDVHSVDQDIDLVAGGNMTITRNNSGSITIAALMGGVSKVITLATQTNPVVITTNTAHDYTEGTPVTIVDVVGMTDLNGNEYFANVLTSNTLALYTDEDLATSLDGTGFGAYTSGGVVTGEYAGAKKLNDLVDVKFGGPGFTRSLKIGSATTGTLNNAKYNTFIGYESGDAVTSGDDNVGLGAWSMDALTTGDNNVAVGKWALSGAVGGASNEGNENVAIGHSAGSSLTTGSYNTFVGNSAGEAVTGTTNNIFIGYDCGRNSTIGNDNTWIGWIPGIGGESGTVKIASGDTVRFDIDNTGAVAFNQAYRFPNADGNTGQVLKTNGAGILTWSGTGAVTSHLLPDTNITYDLGSATHKFRDLYLDGSSIHLGSTILRDDGSGNLQANLTNILEIAADDSTIRTINSGESIKFIGAGSVSTATDAEGNLTITGDVASTAYLPSSGGTLTSTNRNILELISTSTATQPGPNITLYRDSSSVSNNDYIGAIQFKANYSSGSDIFYSSINQVIIDKTLASMESEMRFSVQNNGNLDEAVTFSSSEVKLNTEQVLKWYDHKGTTFETTLDWTTPTADRTITLPDATGTLATQSYVNTQITASEVSDLTGSVFGDDSTVLVDGVNNSINLDGTVKGHIIPDTDDTHDIGSATYKIRDLYLGSNSLHIGDTGTIGITADVMTVAGATGGFKAVAFTGNSGVAIDEFSTDGTMADNSDTAVPTEKAVKTYVDAGVNPTGAVLSFAGASAPTGWLLCYGQAISRTTYAGLFTVLAEVYGVGDGATTFNVPDLRGRTIAGQDDMGGASADRLTGAGGIGGIDGDILGASGGTEAVTLTEAQLPAHTHTEGQSTGTGTASDMGVGGGISVHGTATSVASGSTGSGNAHVNIQPTLILNYIIKT